MKNRSIILCLMLCVSIFNSLYCQQVYFSNRYNLCQDYSPQAQSTSKDILQIEDGYIVAGFTIDTNTYSWRQIPIIKINLDGEQIMYRSYGDTIADYYTGFAGFMKKAITNDVYYIAGSKNYWQPVNYDVGYLMKINGQLDTLWTKEYNLNEDGNRETSIFFNSIELCNNDDLILSGTMNGAYMFLMRTDSSGNTKWYKNFHFGGNTLCTGYSAIQTTDGGFALGGFRYTIGQEETGNPVIVKTDSVGNQQWVKYMGGPLLDQAAFLKNSSDGNIIMGSVYGDEMVGHNARSRINIAKLDNEGNVLWDKKYGRTVYNNNLQNLKVLSDGSIIACGYNAGYYSSEMGWIIKVDENGDSLWYREYAFLNGTSSINRLRGVIETSENGIAACGQIIPMPPDTGIREAWVLKLDSIGCEFAGCDSTVEIIEHGGMGAWRHGSMEIWPNPAHDLITFTLPDIVADGEVELVVYDVFGREMETGRQGDKETGRLGDKLVNRVISLDVSGFAPGMYIAVVIDMKGRRYTGKIVVH